MASGSREAKGWGQPTASWTRAKYGEGSVDAVRCGGCMSAERETEDAGDVDSVTLHLIAQRLADALRRCAAGVWEKRFLVFPDFPGFPGLPLSGLGAWQRRW